MARRLQAMGLQKYANGFTPTLHPACLDEPRAWRKPSTVFVCSMSDLFHPEVPFDFINRVMDTICETPQHTYQILTKRAARMEEYFSIRQAPSNAWLGVTVENREAKERIDHLRTLEASVRFLSCEPLLEDLGELELAGISWIIVGGESGAQARRMRPEWAVGIRKQAEAHGIPFFFKQWGTWSAAGERGSKKANGRMLEGRLVQELPSSLSLAI